MLTLITYTVHIQKVTYASKVSSRITLQDYGMSRISKIADIAAMKATLVRILMLPYGTTPSIHTNVT